MRDDDGTPKGNLWKALTVQMVQMRCKTDKIDAIDKVNLWGNELEDVTLIWSMPNLTVISLAVNKLKSLEDFQYCPRLKELYMRKNDIRDINELNYLWNCP